MLHLQRGYVCIFNYYYQIKSHFQSIDYMSTFADKVKTSAKDLFLFLSSGVFLKNIGLALLLIVGLVLFTFQALKWHTRLGSSISVPEFEGLTLDQVKDLKIRNLEISVADSTWDATKLPLTILTQDPPANTKVKKNRTIYVTVNKKQPPLEELPSVVGKTVSIAESMLKSRNFKIGKKEERKDRAIGTVLEISHNGRKLDPNKLYTLPQESVIDMVVASGLGSVLNVPDLVCMPYDQALAIISGSQLNVGNIRAIGVQDTFNAYVVRQYPPYAPGSIINQGDEVDLTLSPTPLPRCNVDSTFITNPNNTTTKPKDSIRIRTVPNDDVPTEF